MIDCENEVRTRIAIPLRTAFDGIDISGDYATVPSACPHVTIEQIDNRVVRSRTDGTHEMAEVVFEVNVYSNSSSGKKTEAKKIINLIDEIFFGMNFRRLNLDPVRNRDDLTIYRITARYQAQTDGTNFYRS